MSSCPTEILAIGDAIVDVIATSEDSFLAERGFAKGSLRLLDEGEARILYESIGPAREISGGSAANSMAGAAALGLRAAFIGQVADDQLGRIFSHDMRSLGVRFDTPPIAPPPATGVCLILVTPDAQRTMSTCPGASHRLTAAALDADLIRSAEILFLEGYLWGPEQPRSAMLQAARIARSAGRTVAFTLSESLGIGNHAAAVMRMIDSGLIDVLFGNEGEVRQLSGCGNIGDCIAALSPHVGTVVITRGAAGAVAWRNGVLADIAAMPVATIVDTTGAGDIFAAGFLAARLRGRHIEACLRSAAAAAAEVISHFGARPESDLRHLVTL